MSSDASSKALCSQRSRSNVAPILIHLRCSLVQEMKGEERMVCHFYRSSLPCQVGSRRSCRHTCWALAGDSRAAACSAPEGCCNISLEPSLSGADRKRGSLGEGGAKETNH